MNAPKIISLVAFFFYGALTIYVLFAVAQNISYLKQFPDLPDAIIFKLYASLLIVLGVVGIPAVSNLAYYLFLRKRSKENRLPKYATSIALLLALIPVALFVGGVINYFRIKDVLFQIGSMPNPGY